MTPPDVSTVSTKELEAQSIGDLNSDYAERYGFHDPDKSLFKAPKGLSRELVAAISEYKNEPQWMLEYRLKAYEQFLAKGLPPWISPLAHDIDFDDIHYFVRSNDKPERSWDDVPEDIKNTFQKLGIPEAEQKYLAGVSAQYDSQSAYHHMEEELEAQGVIFTDMDTALQEHEELVKKYWGTVIPSNDNKFAALNSAVWSGGSFVHVPAGVHVSMPLQAYFRINTENMGQFERTLIIAEKGAKIHYSEGCHAAGAQIMTTKGNINIEDIRVGDSVVTHKGRYRKVTKLWKKKHQDDMYRIHFYGDTGHSLLVTPGHPFLVSPRKSLRDHNKVFNQEWIEAKDLNVKDYLALPLRKTNEEVPFTSSFTAPVTLWDRTTKSYSEKVKTLPATEDLARLIGLYLAEGSVTGVKDYYLGFDYHLNETHLHEFTVDMLEKTFSPPSVYQSEDLERQGKSIKIGQTEAAQWFVNLCGKGFATKTFPQESFNASPEIRAALCRGIYEGDGSYDKKAFMYRLVIANETMCRTYQQLLLSLGIRCTLSHYQPSGNRQLKWQAIVTRRDNHLFEEIVLKQAPNEKAGRYANMAIDEEYAWLSIQSIEKIPFSGFVYNLSVEEDESYIGDGVVSHNCSSPTYSSSSLHAAVVEIIAHDESNVQYTTVQNWMSDVDGGVFNMVTKRAYAHRKSVMTWLDSNIGSSLTSKYPSIYLMGEGAHGEILSMAFASHPNQHQDAGGKIIHAAPNTTSNIMAKSISKNGGRSTYRGLLEVAKHATNSKSKVVCDALLLDEQSRTDTYPTIRIGNDEVDIGHEATVSKVGDEQIFYLMSHGLSEDEANKLIVNGFIEPIVKEFPMEYAVELTRLVELEMEGSIG